MLGNIGLPTLLFIVLIALLLFGPNKLPELGRAFGRTLREFKKGAKDIMDDDDAPNTRKDVGGSETVRTEDQGSAKDNRRLPD